MLDFVYRLPSTPPTIRSDHDMSDVHVVSRSGIPRDSPNVYNQKYVSSESLSHIKTGRLAEPGATMGVLYRITTVDFHSEEHYQRIDVSELKAADEHRKFLCLT
jgi:hypothetical protein